MPEVDLYLRKSKRDREGVSALTFRTQEERGRSWASGNGYTVRKVWKDNLSAWSDTIRPDFDRALAALIAGESDALWCYALDRLSRKGATDGAVPAILGNGKRLIADYERLDSSDPRDRRRIIDMAEQAREYSDLLSYRVKGTKTQQREEGAWVGNVLFGFRTTDRTRKLSHDPREWRAVLLVFRCTALGMSLRQTAKRLNFYGVPTPTGVEWRTGAVHKILTHPAYEGWQVKSGNGRATRDVYHNKAGQRVCVLADGVEPVPADLVKRARASLEGRSAETQLGNGRPATLLAGVIHCKGCNGSMPSVGRSYRCSRNSAGGNCPDPAMAMVTYLDEYVTNAFVARLSAAEDDDELLPVIAERWAALTKPEESSAAREATAAVKAAQEQLDSLLADRAAGFYKKSEKLFRQFHSAALAELEAAEAVRVVNAPATVDITFLRGADTLRAAWDAADLPARRDLLRLAVDSVTVRRAPRRGAPFDGPARVSIEWAKPEDDE